MDVENMHPFCLPFGLCHDATSSSSLATDSQIEQPILGAHQQQRSNSDDSSSTNGQSITNRSKTSSPSDDFFKHFNTNSSSLSSTTSQSLLQDDTPIGSSDIHYDDVEFFSLELDIDIGANHEADINDDAFSFHEDPDDDHSNNIDLCKSDDWYSTHYSLFSPTSGIYPKRRKSLIKSATGTLSYNHHHLNHHHNQTVFQHVVDPIDIKSSPTLAQLNLNSNDDPTEGLWDTSSSAMATAAASTTSTTTTTTATTISASATSTTQASLDLLSNCTSIINCTTNNHHVACNRSSHQNHINNHNLHHPNHHHHPHHHHHQQHQNQMTISCGSHLSNTNLSPSCHHYHHQHNQHHPHHHHHHHHHHHNSNRFSNASQSTCLAVTPFRKSPDIHHHHSPCCHNLLGHNNSTNIANSNLLLNNGHNLKPSATLNQLNQLQNLNDNSSSLKQLNNVDNTKQLQLQQHQNQQTNKTNQLRCASPALVTSSSSPLSTGAGTTLNAANEGRLIDNKLKENIEYLTALLCNGNNNNNNNSNNSSNSNNNNKKQDTTPQQPPISSTMMKSYATLAHSLSTGPKLLERQYQPPQHQQQQQQTTPSSPASPFQMRHSPLVLNGQQQQQNTTLPTLPVGPNSMSPNEAAPYRGDQVNLIAPQQAFHHNGGKVACSDQWFKPVVESSVSAADSTAENQQPQQPNTLTCNVNDGTLQQVNMTTISMNACPPPNYRQPTTVVPVLMDNNDQAGARSVDSKVLNSLLNTNKCTSPCYPNISQFNRLGQQGFTGWQPSDCGHNQHQQITISDPNHQTLKDGQMQLTHKQDVPSIPPNGKPITLTPLVTNNSIIIQQQQQQQHQASKTKAPLFAQPASPSASSTTSSSGNIENGTTTLMGNSQPVKRRVTTNHSPQATNQNNANNSSNRSGRPNSLSTECSLSSHDEGFSSQVDNDDCASTRDSDDDDDDVDSDDESFYGDYTNNDLIGASISDDADCKWTLNMGRTRRNGQKRFFWQYNVQSKGPKGTRICPTDGSDDPFVLPEASDPVFSNDCQIEGVKHSGKARRGDGNDLTPNPRKLLMIGLELKKLGKIINELAPVTELPMNARNKTRKEKNKLASRACRLKKKAQHEANKIKLYGLQREHQQVVQGIYDIKKLLRETLGRADKEGPVSLTVKTIAEQCSIKVAGRTSDYVNSVLEKVVSGCIDGGLQS